MRVLAAAQKSLVSQQHAPVNSTARGIARGSILQIELVELEPVRQIKSFKHKCTRTVLHTTYMYVWLCIMLCLEWWSLLDLCFVSSPSLFGCPGYSCSVVRVCSCCAAIYNNNIIKIPYNKSDSEQKIGLITYIYLNTDSPTFKQCRSSKQFQHSQTPHWTH